MAEAWANRRNIMKMTPTNSIDNKLGSQSGFSNSTARKTSRPEFVRCQLCGCILLKGRDVFDKHMQDAHKNKVITESAIAIFLSSKATSKPPKKKKVVPWDKPKTRGRIRNADPNTPDERKKSTDMLDAHWILYRGSYRG